LYIGRLTPADTAAVSLSRIARNARPVRPRTSSQTPIKQPREQPRHVVDPQRRLGLEGEAVAAAEEIVELEWQLGHRERERERDQR
jgi:hypothetical protein